MSTSSVPSKRSRTPYFIIGGLVGCLILCVCSIIVVSGAYLLLGSKAQTAATTSVPTQRANQPARLNTPTPETNVSPVDYSTYNGSGASFSVQYPSDWDAQDQEASSRTVVFISPSKTASANVTYGNLGTSNVPDAFDRILTNVFTDAKIIAKKTNADNSMSAELEHTSAALGGRVHTYIRLIPAGSMYYIVQFNVRVDDFDQYKDIGQTIVDSLTVSP